MKSTTNWEVRLWLVRILIATTLIGMVVMGYWALEPYLQSGKYETKSDQEAPKLQLPAYNLQTWAEWPVLEDGRIKPLQTAAIETVRKITGRATFQGQSALPLFISWLFYNPAQPDTKSINWDRYAFILCEDHNLRAEILGLKTDDPTNFEKIHSKYISPMELYQSEPFQRLVVEVDRKRENDSERHTQQLDPMQRKASSVQERLRAYEEITGRLESRDPAIASSILEKRYLLLDPIHFVALDKVKNASWFSIGELKYLTIAVRAPRLPAEQNASLVWEEFMQKRVSLQPRLYMTEEARTALNNLQATIKSGQTDGLIQELKTTLSQRAEKQVPLLVDQAVKEKLAEIGFDKMTEADIEDIAAKSGQKMTKADLKARMVSTFGDQIKLHHLAKNEKTLNDLQDRIKSIGKPYVPEDPRYNQMYMDYLEALFPEMYNAAIRSQSIPLDSVRTVLAAYQAVGTAYHTNDTVKFQDASKNFFDTITTVSKQYAGDTYPGENTTALELLLNRVEPFKWAWISMLLAMICFILSLKLESRIFYQVAFVPMLVSLGFQLFAYYGRVMISGRPPVSNMFETVVFVASMGAVFSLVLEFFYRNTIIVLAGTVVATLGMILADQLPYGRGFDAKIDPLVPVLRSNYWLTVHVMTIVASYAAGALAWAIGNISLILYWFNSDRRDLLKTLANLCYSAIKVAVLLLGVGTLLGGIWAAESWGRFWGWDPKETWALIALVTYLLPLHARYIGWVKDFGMAIASVVCFSAIVMSWYGVNFILGAGLHSYGMGDGGPWTIFFLGSVNLLWVLLVCHRKAGRELAGTAVVA